MTCTADVRFFFVFFCAYTSVCFLLSLLFFFRHTVICIRPFVHTIILLFLVSIAMVFYFTLFSDPSVVCYMGRDKYENEELIKFGWPEDIWFHVDKHSSAHVYVRMPKGKGMDDLSPAMIEECCQLTKQNSIEGCKLNDIRIVYTPWSNLHKTNDMAVGQIGFHKENLRRYFTVAKKDTQVLKRLEKTKVEKNDVDFRKLREERDAEERKEQRAVKTAQQEQEKKEREETKRQEEIRTYAAVMTEDHMRNNQGEVPDEDDFM
ncbi:coiled-coil domain-containing protein 25 [Strigomonas culicis]|uniref:Coiled-coil domain-containing protein 25 n=1 Tax=Strigomonas culicis TaxID=28005 RepID=S9UP69_9TRYP|nr:coiled-coil domain-containing protein 25 [Strigomonas culicis]|eukprot:EPY30559.1 coiled-coil domain-containing protein 25 [Strigomonas culicis]